jgi:hypothetical protein
MCPMDENPYRSASFSDHVPRAALVEKKHSGLGIASFILSLLVGLLMFVAIGVVAVMATINQQDVADDSVEAIMLGMIIFGLLFVDFIALVLGIAGLCQTNRQRLFAGLGTFFSLAIVIMVGGLMLLGMYSTG